MKSPQKVAGVRHCTQGKIFIPSFFSEIEVSNYESSIFKYRDRTIKQVKLIKPLVLQNQSPEYKSFLSGVSLITEISLE
jgi:hypothetical protein